MSELVNDSSESVAVRAAKTAVSLYVTFPQESGFDSFTLHIELRGRLARSTTLSMGLVAAGRPPAAIVPQCAALVCSVLTGTSSTTVRVLPRAAHENPANRNVQVLTRCLASISQAVSSSSAFVSSSTVLETILELGSRCARTAVAAHSAEVGMLEAMGVSKVGDQSDDDDEKTDKVVVEAARAAARQARDAAVQAEEPWTGAWQSESRLKYA